MNFMITPELVEEKKSFNFVKCRICHRNANPEITIKKMWEQTAYGQYKEKFDLINQKYPNPKEMINFILSTKTGITIVGGEVADGQKLLVLIAVTFNDDPLEVIDLKTQ